MTKSKYKKSNQKTLIHVQIYDGTFLAIKVSSKQNLNAFFSSAKGDFRVIGGHLLNEGGQPHVIYVHQNR